MAKPKKIGSQKRLGYSRPKNVKGVPRPKKQK